MPRAAQHKNVLVCIHHVPPDDPFPFSHAYFDRDAFDEIQERNHWILARKGTGYVGLYSQHPYRWVQDQTMKTIELRVDAPDNIWVCELGDDTEW
jgi:hypothetical protein